MNICGVVSSEFLEKKFWKMDLPMEKNFWILVAYGMASCQWMASCH